jgi:aspartyl-tRNA(Asn)/glutamyl-tRNA(Gln) amidotransferase subunit A
MQDDWTRRGFVKSAALGATGLLARINGSAGGPAESDPATLTLAEASQLVRSRKLSPVELTKACLARIEAHNPRLNAFITVMADEAMAQAREAEAEIRRGRWRGPLCGIPVALKDLVDTARVRTTAASGLFKDRIPTTDAAIVRRLKAGGAVLLGKTNLHEFAYGGSSLISYYGAVRNPVELDHVAGGSSGGSAAAVAAHLCYGAIGSDTGGSIREPASCCGIVGLKPAYGRVSTAGVIPLSWYLDHLGPMTRTVRDAALMLQVIAGYDPEDAGSMDGPVPDYSAAIQAASASLRTGIPRSYFYDDLDPEVHAAMDDALAVLKRIAGPQRDIAPLVDDAAYASLMQPYTAVLTAEAYAYHKDYVAKTPELYQPATLARIRAGADVTAATYIESRRRLEEIRRSVRRVFDGVDVLITPTMRMPPLSVAALADANTARPKELLMLHNTRPFNALGLPTISVPCGRTRQGLPIGMQITARDESTVLRLAHAYERERAAHPPRK